MAVGTGYSSTATNGLIFAYDVADSYNSYRGQPGTNITTGVSRVFNGYNKDTFSNGKFFETNGYTETVNIPALGPTVVQSVNIHNVYSGYGTDGNYNCCPTLFTYTGGWNSPIWSGNTTYTYQIIYRCNSGYTGPNFMYHYEYNSSGGYLTEYGVFTTAQQESLGNGWYHAWNTFTTQATAALGYTGLWYYQYNIPDKVSIAAVSIAQGSTIRPPQQLIPSSTTRSSTQGLLDLSPTKNTVTLNTSYNSNAQVYFDATDDFIDTNFPSQTISNVTIEAIVYDTRNNSGYRAIVQNNVNSDDALYIYPNNTLGFWPCGGGSLTVPANQWNYVAVTYNGSSFTYYVNGISQTVNSSCADITDWQFLRIGAYGAGDGERWGGQIPVVKVYNRALSEKEILQNYNHYKTRYKLPGVVYNYNEGSRADLYTGFWNNSTTYNMADFGGIPNVTAHGFTSGPVTYTLTLSDLPTHTKVRYKVYWHLVDSLDNETNQLFIMNSSGGETEILRFTKQYNLTPSISIAASPGTYTWSGSKTYSYRPWANGAYNADGYIIVDSGWVDHTSSTFTARHVMGADQAQADEAEYLSHVEVQLFR